MIEAGWIMDFTPSNRAKDTSDEIAEALYDIAHAERLHKNHRETLVLASGFLLGQASLIRDYKLNASGQKAAS